VASLDRASAEAEIGRALLAHWQTGRASAEPAAPHEGHIHEVYDLLARGASDTQLERHLRRIEREELHRPELETHEHATVLQSLRSVERSM
jgi:hypothetical protein